MISDKVLMSAWINRDILVEMRKIMEVYSDVVASEATIFGLLWWEKFFPVKKPSSSQDRYAYAASLIASVHLSLELPHD